MKIVGLILVIICSIVLMLPILSFPPFGALHSPASDHVSPYYIENSLKDTDVPNFVTSILADYRGYDTMYETTVILAAGLSCFFLLRVLGNNETRSSFYRHNATGVTIRIEAGGPEVEETSTFRRIDSLWTPEDQIIRTACRFLIPFLQIFALYVVAHGHHSPGGGFQGGVILGAGIIVFALAFDLRRAIGRYREKWAAILGAVGVGLYVGTGVLCLLLGSQFLNYSQLAGVLGVDRVMARSHGILIVETGVAMAVMAVMIWIYYNISSRGEHEEGL